MDSFDEGQSRPALNLPSERGSGSNSCSAATAAVADSDAAAAASAASGRSPCATLPPPPPPGSATTNNDGQDKEPRKLKTVEKRIFKVIVIGDSNVGKTCLTFRFCEGKFPKKVEATIGVDFREKGVAVGDEEIKLQLWDTAGQERFRKSMVPHYYRNVHAVVFVYDMTKRSTFLNLGQWVAECDRFDLSSAVPRVLIGNKCDMVEQIQVTTHEAQRFADLHHMPLFETSARADDKNDHVEAIFMTLAHKLKSSQPLMPQFAQASFSQSGSRASTYGGGGGSSSGTIRVQHYDTIGQDSGDGCRC